MENQIYFEDWYKKKKKLKNLAAWFIFFLLKTILFCINYFKIDTFYRMILNWFIDSFKTF